MRSPAEVLDAAADRIERDGWHQGDFFADQPSLPSFDESDIARVLKAKPQPCCVMGALIAEADGDMELAEDRAGRLLELHLGLSYISQVPQWNDEAGRTKEEVVAALRAAAAKERGQ